MRHLIRNIVLVVAVLLIAIASIYPPERNLRLGKDLAGGVSLVYAVELQPDDPPQTVENIIDVLSRRLDPQGQFDISIVRQGRDRIEITMPLPTARVQSLRNEYESALNRFYAYSFDVDALERALRLSGEERREAIERLWMDQTRDPETGERRSTLVEARKALLEPVLEAAERAERAQGRYREALVLNLGEEEVSDLLIEAADAEVALEEARLRAIQRRVTPTEVDLALQRDDTPVFVRDDATGRQVSLPSRREEALNVIRGKIAGDPDDPTDELLNASEALDTVLEAFAAYIAERRGLDSPEDLQRMVRGAGVLQFRIAVQPGQLPGEDRIRAQMRDAGPSGFEADQVIWMPINKPEDWFESLSGREAMYADPASYFSSRYRLVAERFEDEFYVLLHDRSGKRLTAAEGEWSLASAFATTDQLGKPAVGFRMNTRGAQLLGDLTGNHRNEPMAILLDGRVYSAPNVLSRISSNGIIQGSYTPRELQYLIQTMNAGALQARILPTPLSVNTLAPTLGQDNLRQGMRAGWIALVLVCGFMVFYYFSAGFVATFALLCNAILILGVMSLARASFTLPGIAGIILTFGMAVDANVLIYERLREEILAGNDLRTSVRLAFQKALSTIVDANVTNLIICVVLGYTATQEIKGFAITLGVGVVTTMFSSLVITRIIFALLVDKVKLRKMSQLPLLIPAIDRLFTPKIDWMRFRPAFVIFALAFLTAGIAAVVIQGEEMLDTEFRGGTAFDLRLQEVGEDRITFDGEPFTGTLTRPQVERAVRGIAYAADRRLGQSVSEDALAGFDADALALLSEEQLRTLSELRNASVLVIGGEADNITSDHFRVKTTITDQQLILDVIVARFREVVDSQPPLVFAGVSEEFGSGNAPVYPIDSAVIGENEIPGIDEEYRNNVAQFVGGVAIVLDELRPAPSERDLRRRLELAREQDPSSLALRRDWQLIILEGDAESVSRAVVVIRDRGINFIFDEQRWRADLATPEWNLLREELGTATTLASVQSFSAEIARTFRAQAITAMVLSMILILIYIWVRFGSPRYAVAAILGVFHDVIAVIGLIAFAEILYEYVPAAAGIGIQPFRIDLGLIAALLTIIGYSLNDTIIILDRIRENRGKLPYASRDVVNLSINQTISRTVITSGTTLLALIVMFVIGGDGLASFTYALICGIVVGTFSSIAIAAPIVCTGVPPTPGRPLADEEDAEPVTGLAPTA